MARYRQVKNLAQYAREFKIGKRRILDILAAHGVQPQARQQLADEQALLRAYDCTESISAVSRPHGVAEQDVQAILDRHGVPNAAHGAMSDFRPTAKEGAAATGTRAVPGDLLFPAEAAWIARTDTAA